jgi:phenylacetate-CoA ligase
VFRYLRPATGGRCVEEQLRALDTHDLGAFSEHALSTLLQHATTHNRYYRQFATNETLRLADFPVLTKEIIQREFEALRSPSTARTFLNSSGGSTGAPQTFLQDEHFASWTATTTRFYFKRFLGIDEDYVKKVVLWGSERDTFKQRDWKARTRNWLTNTLFLNSFLIPEESWKLYVRRINSFKPYFIRGYASSLYELASAVERYDLQIHQPSFVCSSAEMLHGFMRQKIEDVFGCKAFDFYGSREVGPVAAECRGGSRHIFSFNNWVEVTSAGEILITNLHNYSMPLIRYAIGDTGEFGRHPCVCGSTLPYFTRLTGRVSDHFINGDGGLIHGEYFTHLFYHRTWVQTFQVNQVSLTEIQILVVRRGEAPSTEMEDIEAKIRLVMSQACKVTWRFVDEIEKTPQGKHLFTRSLVER